MDNNKIHIAVTQARFELLPDPLLFADCAPLASGVHVTALCKKMGIDDPADYLQSHRSCAIKDGLWPEDEPAILWLLLAMEMQAFEPGKKIPRYLNVLADQLREALIEMPMSERKALLDFLGLTG